MRALPRAGALVSARTGAVSLSFLVLTLALLPAALGVPTLMALWHKTARLQLQLDQCTGELALALKRESERMEGINTRMKVLRAALVAEVLLPPAILETQLALQSQWLYGVGVLAAWRARQAVWMGRGCGVRAFTLPPPSLPFLPDGSDAIGPRPFRPTAETNETFRIFVRSERRKSLATVTWRNSKWHAQWARAAFF